MLSPGGSGERTRGLDLGADDVLSLPFDPHELLSRLRSQLRSKHIADESRDRLRLAEENRNANLIYCTGRLKWATVMSG